MSHHPDFLTFDHEPTDAELSVILGPEFSASEVEWEETIRRIAIGPRGIPMRRVVPLLALFLLILTGLPWLLPHLGIEFPTGLSTDLQIGLTVVVWLVGFPALILLFRWLNRRIEGIGPGAILNKKEGVLELPYGGLSIPLHRLVSLVEVTGWHRFPGGGEVVTQWGALAAEGGPEDPNSRILYVPIAKISPSLRRPGELKRLARLCGANIRRVRARKVVASVAYLATACLSACTSITPRSEVAVRVDAVSERRLEEHVAALCAIGPRPAGDAEATEATLVYLERELRAIGYEPRREDFELEVSRTEMERTASGGWSMVSSVREVATLSNLIAEVRGSELPDAVVEVCAHYDTVWITPGADDNSSGVAGLLEIARVVADARPKRTIRFCLFAAEEIGLEGSHAHLATMDAAAREQFVALIDLEMIGYADDRPGSQSAPVNLPFFGFPDSADFVAVIGTFSTGWLGATYESAIDAYVPELRYWSGNRIGGFFEDSRRSDHAPYWDAGLPAVMISDTSEFRNDNYHRPSDLPETLDYGFMRQVTQATVAAVLHLADR